jgi:hypothetical protein
MLEELSVVLRMLLEQASIRYSLTNPTADVDNLKYDVGLRQVRAYKQVLRMGLMERQSR